MVTRATPYTQPLATARTWLALIDRHARLEIVLAGLDDFDAEVAGRAILAAPVGLVQGEFRVPDGHDVARSVG